MCKDILDISDQQLPLANLAVLFRYRRCSSEGATSLLLAKWVMAFNNSTTKWRHHHRRAIWMAARGSITPRD